MQLPIVIGLRRSVFVAIATVALHGVAAVALFLPNWPRWVSAVGALLLALSAIGAWRGLRNELTLRLHADGRLDGRQSGQADFEPLQLLPPSVVHPLLTVLRVVKLGRARTIVVGIDSAGPADRRRLRVWLRWRGTGVTSAGDAL